ncbi:BrxA/BrxB family bacilliredoxin [Bryobacter aggregatus]|uniref:BrxA/BrxB family bacilliredoxin n=1 Tax=Bryobacter aggregatus TaxID=360054 RepID=UPI0004E248C2|nr:BrxA/BrxB family bacilliredoxin [Bryobacter aggregatus]
MAYPEQFLMPMRQDLTKYGVEETRTPEAVDEALKSETVLMVVNSICGCAAGKARPAIGAALQNQKKPAKISTVFAGGDEAATAHLRGILSEFPPSSPSMFLFKNGKPVFALHRRDIESSDQFSLSLRLKAAFEEHC